MKFSFPKSSCPSVVLASMVGFGVISSGLEPLSAAVWLGMSSDLQQTSNWSTGAVPGDAEAVEFNGSGSFQNLVYGGSFQGAGGGIGTLTMKSTQTGAITINASSGSPILRFAANAGITMEAGAGALTLGNLTSGVTVINIGGTNGTANFINASTSKGTFGANSMLNRGGSSSAQSLVFGGTGDWDLLGTINSNLQYKFTKSGTGTLYVAKTLVHDQVLLEQGVSNFGLGLTANELLRVGASAQTATATVSTGEVNIGGAGSTHALYVGHRTTNTVTGATSGELNLAAATSVHVQVGTLEIGKHESLSGITGNVTGKLILSTVGANVVSADRILQGFIGGGSTTVVRGDLVLGGMNQFMVDDWYVGGDKAIGSTTIVTGGQLELNAKTSGKSANLYIGANLSSGTGTKPIESVMDVSAGAFFGNLDKLTIGMFGTGTGGGKGSLIFKTGDQVLNVNQVILAQTGGSDKAQTTGSLRMKGGILNVTQGVTDGGGTASLHVDAGTATFGKSVSVDSLTTGYAASLSVQSGSLHVGNGGASDVFSVGWRTTDPTVNSQHELNLSGNSAVTVNVNQMDLSSISTLASGAPLTQTTVRLSQVGGNDITAKTLYMSHVLGGSTGKTSSHLLLGQSNRIAVDDFYIGSFKGQGMVRFDTGSGNLTLVGATRATANVYVGYNYSPGTSTTPEESHFNLTGGTVTATIGDLVVGSYGSVITGGSNNGGAKGRVTFNQGTLTVDRLIMATTAVPDSANYLKTEGTFTMNGGTLLVNQVTKGAGIANFEFNSGNLKVGQFGDSTRAFTLVNQGGGILDHGVSSQIGSTLLYGDYLEGAGAFNRFDLSLTQGSDRMKVWGNILLGGTLSLQTIAGGTALLESFTLIENLGSNSISGTFVGLAEGAWLNLDFGTTSGLYRLSYEGGLSGRDVVLTQVPEPHRWMLLMAGVAGFVLRRRRR